MLMVAEQFQSIPDTAGTGQDLSDHVCQRLEAESQRGKATCPSHTVLEWQGWESAQVWNGSKAGALFLNAFSLVGH